MKKEDFDQLSVTEKLDVLFNALFKEPKDVEKPKGRARK